MSYNLTVNDTNSVADKAFPNNQTINAADVAAKEVLIPVAQPAVLTISASAHAGSLTMTNPEHGLTTGAFIDLYWQDAQGVWHQARNATVGTVVGEVVPFTLASGEVMPAAATPIIAALVQTFAMALIGNNLLALLGAMDQGDNGVGNGTITLLDTGGTVEDLYMELTPTNSYRWIGDFTNPLTGKTIDTVHMSHNNLLTPVNMRVTGLLT